MERKISVSFYDFSGGDIGRTLPNKAATLSSYIQLSSDDNASNQFSGVNLWNYPRGIGPRPPFIRFNPTTPLLTKAVVVAGTIGSTGNGVYALMSDKKAYQLKTGTVLTGTAPATNVSSYGPAITTVGSTKLFAPSTEGGKGISFSTSLNLSTEAAMPVGNLLARFGLHTVLLDKDGRTIYWSSPSDATTWPAAQFQLLPAFAPMDMTFRKNSLVISAVNDSALLWDILTVTGTLSVNAILQRTDSGEATVYHGAVGISSSTFGGGPIQNISGDKVCWINNEHIITFDGTETNVEFFALPRLLSTNAVVLGATYTAPVWRIVSSPIESSFWVLGSETGSGGNNPRTAVAVYRDQNGAWWPQDPGITYHADTNSNFSNTGHYTLSNSPQSSLFGYVQYDIASKTQYLELLTSGRDAATAEAPKQYRMSLIAQTPDTASNDGDTAAPVVAEMRTVDWFADRNWEIGVRSVTIDYVCIGSGTETITCQVEAINPQEDLGINRSSAQIFTPPSISGEIAEEGAFYRGRHTFKVYDQGTSQGFRVYFSAWSGIMLEQIVVEGDLMESRI